MTRVYYPSTTMHEEWGGHKRHIILVVHKNRSDFVKAAERSSSSGSDGYWEGCLGCFHPEPYRESYDKKLGKFINTSEPHRAGIMRLIEGYLTNEIITHECVHAAAAIWRMDVTRRKDGPGTINLGTDCDWREEGFAYLVGDLTHQVFTALWS
jgi:hypothetical protein